MFVRGSSDAGSFLTVFRPGWVRAWAIRFLAIGFLATDGARHGLADEPFPADRPIHEAIDHYIDAKLVAVGISAAPLADEASLLRRTTLDLVGRIPTAAEAREYLASIDPQRREKLIAKWIDHPSFDEHQAREFNTMLMSGVRGGGNGVRDYLRKALRERRPWDRMFRELLLGEADDPQQQGAIQFVRQRAADLDKLTNDASVLFFGVNVSCAQCHDHPLVSTWTQHHFFGMKSFFSRTFANGDLIGERAYGRVSFKTSKGEEQNASLMFLSGAVIPEPEQAEPDEAGRKAEKERLEELKKNKQPSPAPEFSRRAKLVEVALQSENNRVFGQAIVNRLWARLIGRGLVDPVDQMHPENAPSHPELLQWLARDFVQHGYDLRRLIAGIVSSKVYARTSRWDSGDRPAADQFAVAHVRPLSPSQYAMALRVAASNPDRFADPQLADPQRAAAFWSQIESEASFLANSFEEPQDDFQVSVTEALLLSNHPRVEKELLDTGSRSLIGKLMQLDSAEAKLDTAFWNVLSRSPDEEEKRILLPALAANAESPAKACQQLVWVLLASSECRFNH